MKYDICVVGLGYIGLPTASIFATRGKKVLGVDVVESVVATINQGKIHIEEPDLDVLVRAAVQSGNLEAATEPQAANVYIIAVPTPFHEKATGEKLPDLGYVEAATKSIAKKIDNGAQVILESTSPVGTTEQVQAWMEAALAAEERDINLASLLYAHCPERILPGQMLKELVSNDRIAGGLSPEAAMAAKELYESFCTAEIVLTNARTAEMAKLTENASRDVGIAFANELSMICEELDIDVWELIELANRHPRVNILQPGPGVGGHCIAVDPWFIVGAAPKRARLIRTAREVNQAKPSFVVQQVVEKAERYKNPVIACLGLAFKANVDDLRESPALWIVEQLAEKQEYELLVAEPFIRQLPKSLEGKGRLIAVDEAVKAADIVVLLVDHRAFRDIPTSLLKSKVLIDSKGFFR
mgnify:CR=1 FL=1